MLFHKIDTIRIYTERSHLHARKKDKTDLQQYLQT